MTRIPDSFVPVIGWRAWSVNNYNKLTSQIYDMTTWESDKPLRAVHKQDIFSEGAIRKNDTDFCGDNCREKGDSFECGIHAFKEICPLDQVSLVIGEVELWGIVRVHEWGYRAEYAYPRSFHIPKPFTVLTKYIECLEPFNVPITIYQSPEERRDKLCPDWEKEYQRYSLSVSKSDLSYQQVLMSQYMNLGTQQTNLLVNPYQQRVSPLASGRMAYYSQLPPAVQEKSIWQRILNRITGA